MSTTPQHVRKLILTASLAAAFILVALIVMTAPTPAVAYQELLTPTASPTATLPAMRLPLEVSPAVSETLEATMTVTPTQTLTPTATSSPTPSPTPTVEPSPTPTWSPFLYMPLVMRNPTPTPIPYVEPHPVLYCSYPGNTIPDNNPNGTSDSIYIDEGGLITDLDVSLDISHGWVGDLIVELSHYESGQSVTLIDRVGYPSSQYGCGSNNIKAILDDQMSSSVEYKCATSPAAVSGGYIPHALLANFKDVRVTGNWTLRVTDNYPNDDGKLNSWCLRANISESPPPPTPTPEIPPLPLNHKISGLTGKGQALPLDCESRSAVDWARYFGYTIGELTFFYGLPHSDNPDTGFVGDVYGLWGQVPPNDYGVHAEPIAAELRAYGIPAQAKRPMSWDQLRHEISSWRPVIVWIVGSNPIRNGLPRYYTSADKHTSIVSPYEHTVVVTGYSDTKVFYLNGGTIYDMPIGAFLDSWSALGNMGVVYEE